MKARDLNEAAHELKRLDELKSALGDFMANGYFEIKALKPRNDYKGEPVEFVQISVRDYGAFATAYGLSQFQEIVRAAYEAEIRDTKDRLAKLGVDDFEAKKVKAA